MKQRRKCSAKPLFFLLAKTTRTHTINCSIGLHCHKIKNPYHLFSKHSIMWALQKLLNYLYGITKSTIYTDHQFSPCQKINPITKLKDGGISLKNTVANSQARAD